MPFFGGVVAPPKHVNSESSTSKKYPRLTAPHLLDGYFKSRPQGQGRIWVILRGGRINYNKKDELIHR